MTNDAIMPIDNDRITRKLITIDPNQALTLSVTNSSGNIAIAASDRQDVEIVTERTDAKWDKDDARIEIEADGNRISVHPNWQLGNTISELAHKVKHQLKEGFNADDWDFKKMKFGMNAHFDIRIELPRELGNDSAITIKSASGDISAADIPARVSAATANGDIELNRITGKVSAHSASGDISLTRIIGSIEANTANGDITVEGGEAWTALRAVNGDIQASDLIMKNARITTVSGDVNASVTMNNKDSYSFDTVSGDINLKSTLPTTGASLNFKAVSGDAKVSGDWTAASGKRSWQLAAGGDGPEIRVKAVSGDLKAIAITDPTVTLQQTDPPQETPAEPGQDSAQGTQADFDWEKAKSWVSSVAQKISQVVNEMDESGERRRAADQSAATASTEPIPPTPPTPVSPTTPVPPTPPTPGVDHLTTIGEQKNDSPTEPVDVRPFPADTTPIPSPEPVAEAAPGQTDTPETTGQRRLRLLEAVQRGEMTVDEALAQLDGDGSTEADS